LLSTSKWSEKGGAKGWSCEKLAYPDRNVEEAATPTKRSLANGDLGVNFIGLTPQPSCRGVLTSSSTTVFQNLACSGFASLPNGIVDDVRWQRIARAIDEQTVFPNHAATFRGDGIRGWEFTLDDSCK
jgi:hypothetical protein